MIIVWPQCLLQCMCVCGVNEHACIHVCVCACSFDSFGGDIAPETPTRVVGTCLTPEKPNLEERGVPGAMSSLAC